MKKFFSGGKPKASYNVVATSPKSNDGESPLPTPIHAVYTQPQQQSQQRMDGTHDDPSYDPVDSFPHPHPLALAPSRSSSYGSLPPGASPPAPRPPSPHQHPVAQLVQEFTTPQTLRKKNQPSNMNPLSNANSGTMLGILRVLEPQQTSGHQHSASNDAAIIPPSTRPSLTLDQRFASVNSVATANSLHDGEHAKDKEKNKKEGGWLSKFTGEPRENQKEKEKEHRSQSWQLVHHEEQGELTRSIGFLTATASEDWGLVLDVCERASANEANAKEAIRALKKEFKYGEPAAQLSAARLWAIMLRNSSELFIGQSTSRKFFDTLEDLLLSSRTSPVVKERVLDVLAAAAYASGSKKDTGFRGLWKKVKPHDKPDEGMPFDTDDAMFNPPVLAQVPSDQGQHTGTLDSANHPDQSHHFVKNSESHGKTTDQTNANGTADATPPPTKDKERHRERDKERGERRERDRDRHRDRERDKDREPRDRDRRDSNRDRDRDREHRRHRDDDERRKERKHKKRHKSPSARIIPPEEDIRRLFQECIIGKGNAGLLSQALVHTVPEDFDSTDGGGDVIKEFRLKCISSQELIAAQISWATAGAERSRKEKGQDVEEETTEEKLLGDLLAANEELMSALKQYEDLERVAMERKAEEESRKDVGGRGRRAENERQQHLDNLRNNSSRGGRSSRSSSPHPLPPPPAHSARVPSPSRTPSRPSSVILGQPHHLAPPAAPHGPRSPGLRTPSPGEGVSGLKRMSIQDPQTTSTESDDDYNQPFITPSEKALGKRRCADTEDAKSEHARLQQQNRMQDEFNYNGVNMSPTDDRYSVNYNSDEDGSDGYGERGGGGGYHHHKHPPVQFVYDAAAERTRQRLLEGKVES
ncbi:hypothetical protein E1B28_006606 [Marasmius oreades]|uniref:VHS domain-containing protein n=1 Tax=Marasmius oreades TaxID=181124 RepID=A0A9P8AA16_9AGAR|nr:uncharacterized protein E1B28_006606 [Marasmius oreades]KAG7095922.1 hypothetical protein E1B28_006606 [Marasmius oreades]